MVMATWPNPSAAGVAVQYPNTGMMGATTTVSFFDGVKITPTSAGLFNAAAGLKGVEIKLDRAYDDITGKATCVQQLH